MRSRILGLAAVLVIGAIGHAQAELLVNGDFRHGVYSDTADIAIGSDHLVLTNPNVPVGWTAEPGFYFPFWNGVTTFNPYAGSSALFLGNDPGFPMAGISQTVTTIPRDTYVLSMAIANVEQTGCFQVLINGNVALTVASSPEDWSENGLYAFTSEYSDGRSDIRTPTTPSQYSLESFSFVGTGADTLTMRAVSDSASFEVGNVSISAVPEPSGWATVLGGVALLGVAVARRRTRMSARRD